MDWILFIMFINYTTIEINTEKFKNKENCGTIAKSIRKDLSKGSVFSEYRINIKCVDIKSGTEIYF